MSTHQIKHEDTRSAEHIEEHQALATRRFKEASAAYLQQVQKHPEHAPASTEHAGDSVHTYRVQMTVGGFFFVVVTVRFYDEAGTEVAYFEGKGGGLVIGGGGTWGAARLARPIESYRGESARFYGQFVAAVGGVSTVNLWRMNGEPMGAAVGGGVGAGAGIFGGEGPLKVY